jgi:ATP-binding cassette subfamily B protein RaxB
MVLVINHCFHIGRAGMRRVGPEEVNRSFTGIALELWPTREFIPLSEVNPVTIRELLGSVSGLGPFVVQAITLATLLEVVTLCCPILFQWVVDHAILKRDGRLPAAVAGLLFFGLFEVWAAAARDWATINVSNRISVSWQANLFSHLVRLPIAFFEKRSTVDILSRFDASDIVRGTLTGSFANIMLSGTVTVFTLAAMLFYNRTLCAVVLSGGILYLGIRHVTLAALRERAKNQAFNDAQLRNHLTETVYGVLPLKLFGQEAQRSSKWLNLLVDATNARSSAGALNVWLNAGSTSVLRIEMAALVGIGSLSVIHGTLSVGAFFAFLAYKDHFNANILPLINNVYDIGALKIHLDRLSDIVREVPEAQSFPPSDSLNACEARDAAIIEFSSLWFRYSDSDPWIIRDLSLKIWSGECIAITGLSGSGKSTLVKLMCGLLAPTRGSLLMNGLPVAGTNSISRQSLGIVLQEDTLFSGTIAENIHFFSDNPDSERVEECARLAALDVDIAAMPMRYLTRIGTSGAGISGGQRQRLLIARALYKRPRVLIFDESTSHLDLKTERAISQSLSQLSMTRIIVAHRPETIEIAHRVVAISDAQLEYVRGEFRDIVPESREQYWLGNSNNRGVENHVRTRA